MLEKRGAEFLSSFGAVPSCGVSAMAHCADSFGPATTPRRLTKASVSGERAPSEEVPTPQLSASAEAAPHEATSPSGRVSLRLMVERTPSR
jgi:hypothetical protein